MCASASFLAGRGLFSGDCGLGNQPWLHVVVAEHTAIGLMSCASGWSMHSMLAGSACNSTVSSLLVAPHAVEACSYCSTHCYTIEQLAFHSLQAHCRMGGSLC